MVKYSKKRNLNNRKVTRHNSKKRNNFKKNTRNRKVSKKGGAAENTSGQADYNNFFKFLIQKYCTHFLKNEHATRIGSLLLNCSITKKDTESKPLDDEVKKLFPKLTPKEFQELFTYYAKNCYEVSEDSKTIKITRGVRYQTGFNNNNNSLYFNTNNNNLGFVKIGTEYGDNEVEKQILFDYFQNRYESDLQFLKSKAYKKKKRKMNY